MKNRNDIEGRQANFPRLALRTRLRLSRAKPSDWPAVRQGGAPGDTLSWPETMDTKETKSLVFCAGLIPFSHKVR